MPPNSEEMNLSEGRGRLLPFRTPGKVLWKAGGEAQYCTQWDWTNVEPWHPLPAWPGDTPLSPSQEWGKEGGGRCLASSKTCSKLFCHLDDEGIAKIHCFTIVLTKSGWASSKYRRFLHMTISFPVVIPEYNCLQVLSPHPSWVSSLISTSTWSSISPEMKSEHLGRDEIKANNWRETKVWRGGLPALFPTGSQDTYPHCPSM